MKNIYFVIIFTVLQSISESARILSVLPTVSRSHCLTVPDAKNFNFYENLSLFESQRRKWDKLNRYSKYITEKPKLKHFIENDGSHFDLVIVEEFFLPAFYAFAYKYRAPLVLISTFGSGHFINEYMGNALELSYVSHELSELYGELTFTDRLLNLVYTTYDLFARKYYSLMYQNQLAKELFKNFKYMPHVEDLERNSSLVLINAHYSLSVMRPILPNIVEIAGLHIEDVKPLDKNIREILEEAKNGAILFSLGSSLDFSLQPKGFVIELLKTFGKLKQTVILKWNSDEKLPFEFENIHAFKWLPQNDILAHPNTVAFITHGGLHSSLEAAHHGVPITHGGLHSSLEAAHHGVPITHGGLHSSLEAAHHGVPITHGGLHSSLEAAHHGVPITHGGLHSSLEAAHHGVPITHGGLHSSLETAHHGVPITHGGLHSSLEAAHHGVPITHGGLHSSLEAAHHGVPIVCSPFFGDQHLNCEKAFKMGYGIKLANLTDDLHGALTTLLTDKSYKNTAQELSRRFKDRPVSAIDTAMFWIEYVIRHNGADFLKGPRRNLYWFQYMFLDVLAVMVGGYWLLLTIVRKLMSLIFKRAGNKSEKVKKN